MSHRLALGLLLVLLALMLASGYWLWSRLQDLAPAGPAVPVPTETPMPTVTPVPTIVKAPPGYRLAGVAVGEPESFAVVEASSGSSALYRVGDDVPGLGRLLHIEAERVVVQSESGQFELWLTRASTATPGHAATAAATPPAAQHTPPTQATTTRPRPPASGAGTAHGSTPSSDPGPPAS